MKINRPELTGFDLSIENEVDLVVTVHSKFDSENKIKSWAGNIADAFEGNYRRVIVDMHHMKIASSTLYAGLIQLTQHFESRSQTGITLRHSNDTVKRALAMLHITHLFSFEEESVVE